MAKSIESRISRIEQTIKNERVWDMVDNPLRFLDANPDECPKVPRWQAGKMLREILEVMD
jgi:hypothetical protein